MATSGTALPPMGEISMVGIWIETMLYGVNCVMYGLCMFILLRGGKIATLRWVLLVTSTILFLLSTVHVGASLQQLLDAFVYTPADVPDYSTIYWLNYTTTLRMLKDYVYVTLVSVQDFILIWRLYVVFMCDWRVIIFPIILEAGSVGSAYAASAVSALPEVGLYGSVVPSLSTTSCILSILLNTSVMVAIATRLWWIGRRVAFLTATQTATNRYVSSIYVVIESGALFAATITVILVLYVTNSPASMSGIDVGSQLAALTPLLIVVQAGLTGRYGVSAGDSLKITLTAREKNTFRVVHREDSRQEVSLHAKSSGSTESTHV